MAYFVSHSYIFLTVLQRKRFEKETFVICLNEAFPLPQSTLNLQFGGLCHDVVGGLVHHLHLTVRLLQEELDREVNVSFRRKHLRNGLGSSPVKKIIQPAAFLT